jgi:hypothetical protein
MIGRDFLGEPVIGGKLGGEIRHVCIAVIVRKPRDGSDPVAVGEPQQQFVRAHVDRDDARGPGLVISLRFGTGRATERQQQRRREAPQKGRAAQPRFEHSRQNDETRMPA